MWRDHPPGFGQLVAASLFIVGSLIAITYALTARNPNAAQDVIIGNTLTQYDFDRDSGGWREFDADGQASFAWDAATGALVGQIRVGLGYVTTTQPTDFRDTAITATLQQTIVPPDTNFSAGVVCRGDNAGNGYYFLISNTGLASIRKGTPDNPDDLVALADWRTFDAIQPTDDGNTVTAVCASDYLALYVNNVFLLEAQDNEFRTGFSGVAVAGAVGADNERPGADLVQVGVSVDTLTVRQATWVIR
jgi:hypothetical protein